MRLAAWHVLPLLALTACPERKPEPTPSPSSSSTSTSSTSTATSTSTPASTAPIPFGNGRSKTACVDNTQCPGGGCEYIIGCQPITGYCGPAAHSCLVSRPYCGCDGVTFQSCPPPHHSYAHEGPCEPPRDK